MNSTKTYADIIIDDFLKNRKVVTYVADDSRWKNNNNYNNDAFFPITWSGFEIDQLIDFKEKMEKQIDQSKFLFSEALKNSTKFNQNYMFLSLFAPKQHEQTRLKENDIYTLGLSKEIFVEPEETRTIIPYLDLTRHAPPGKISSINPFLLDKLSQDFYIHIYNFASDSVSPDFENSLEVELDFWFSVFPGVTAYITDEPGRVREIRRKWLAKVDDAVSRVCDDLAYHFFVYWFGCFWRVVLAGRKGVTGGIP